jgi:ABC-type transport system involved in multi-copper enzyme maturation permease subunit
MSTLIAPTYAAARADLLRTRRWPAVWVTLGVWLLLNAMFGYIFDYVSYASGDSSFSNEGQSRAEIIARLLPSGVPDNLPQGMPLFGGALMMVLGALLAGSGYGWGTWKTAFTQGPSRTATALGSLASLLAVVAGVVVVTLALDFAFALGIAGLESRHVVWPSLGHTVQMTGAAYLVTAMWALVGYLLGTLAKGPALSVGLGLVWTLVVENLLRGVGESLSAVATFTHFLPGTAAGSLVGQLLPASQVNDSPGLFTTLGTTQALVTMLAYLVLAPVVTVALVRRRDVA